MFIYTDLNSTMTAKIIDGNAIAKENLSKLKQEILERENEGIRPPCLAVILSR